MSEIQGCFDQKKRSVNFWSAPKINAGSAHLRQALLYVNISPASPPTRCTSIQVNSELNFVFCFPSDSSGQRLLEVRLILLRDQGIHFGSARPLPDEVVRGKQPWKGQ